MKEIEKNNQIVASVSRQLQAEYCKQIVSAVSTQIQAEYGEKGYQGGEVSYRTASTPCADAANSEITRSCQSPFRELYG